MLLNCGVGEDSRVPWTPRRSNHWVLKEINPEYSLEGLMLKLKFQYFGHLIPRTNSFERPWCWERLKAGGEGDNRGWDGWMASLTQWTWVWASSGWWWWTGKPGVLQSMRSQRPRHDWATELKMPWRQRRKKEGTYQSRKLLAHGKFFHRIFLTYKIVCQIFAIYHTKLLDFSKLEKPKNVTCHWLPWPGALV